MSHDDAGRAAEQTMVPSDFFDSLLRELDEPPVRNQRTSAAAKRARDAAVRPYYDTFLRELPQRRTDRDAWRARWAAYAAHLADGPTTPEEFEKIRAERRTGETEIG